jgi:hypothetical protein
MTDRTEYHRLILKAQDLDDGANITALDAVDLARAVVDLAEKAGMTGSELAADARCRLARAVLARAERTAALGSYGRDVLARCRLARLHHGGHPSGAWSMGEQVAVALVLRDREWMNHHDYTVQAAAQRVAAELDVPADFNAWLDAIRTELDGKAPR